MQGSEKVPSSSAGRVDFLAGWEPFKADLPKWARVQGSHPLTKSWARGRAGQAKYESCLHAQRTSCVLIYFQLRSSGGLYWDGEMEEKFLKYLNKKLTSQTVCLFVLFAISICQEGQCDTWCKYRGQFNKTFTSVLLSVIIVLGSKNNGYTCRRFIELTPELWIQTQATKPTK